jgi:tripartite-type tricarboxylate transporter receptor subunit TctC
MLMMPVNTPDDVVSWYQTEFSRALKSESVKSMFNDNLLSERPDLQTAKAAKSFIVSKDKEWQPLVDSAVQKIKN